VVIEQRIRAPIARAVDVEVVSDPVTVDRPDGDIERAETAVEDHAAIVRQACGPVRIEVLEREPNLAREHQIRDLELPELHADAGTEQVAVTEPSVLDHRLAVSALLREDAVEVVSNVLRQRRAREQLDQVRRLEIEIRIVSGEAG